jgi:hypothetical protein
LVRGDKRGAVVAIICRSVTLYSRVHTFDRTSLRFGTRALIKATAEDQRERLLGRHIEIGLQLDAVLLERCRIGSGWYSVWGSTGERKG